MVRRRWMPWLVALFIVGLELANHRAWAEESPEALAKANDSAPKFLRLSRDGDGEPIAMETAVVTYTPEVGESPGLSVDLIGAVHIGEKSYYEALNKEFEKYDVVLYELVAPPGTRIPKGGGGRSAHPVSMMQGGMKQMLKLESQVELIDYQQPNLIHADMSPEDFSKSMEERGDNFFALFFRMVGRSLAEQSKQQVLAREQKGRRPTSDADLLLAMFNPNQSGRLKQLMAEQFENMEGMMNVFEGPKGSTLISERNKVALEGLRQQIAAGKKRIGIFYGAGHMPDMEKRLISDFNLHRDKSRWLVAWHLADDERESDKEE